MRRKIFVLLTVSAVLMMALAGCVQKAEHGAENGMPKNHAAQTDDGSYGQSADPRYFCSGKSADWKRAGSAGERALRRHIGGTPCYGLYQV